MIVAVFTSIFSMFERAGVNWCSVTNKCLRLLWREGGIGTMAERRFCVIFGQKLKMYFLFNNALFELLEDLVTNTSHATFPWKNFLQCCIL